MQPKQVIRRLRETASRYGARAALHDLRCRAVNRLLSVDILRAIRVSMADVPSPDMFDAPGFEARFLSPGELEAKAREGTHDFSLEFLERARQRGDRCYGIFDGDTLASHGWYAERATPIDERYMLHFDSAFTYMFKGWTLPAYRGQRLHAIGMCRALRAFTEEGKKGLVSYVASNNFASLRSVARMGYRIFGNLYLARAGTHALAFASGGCLAYGVRATVIGHGGAPRAVDATPVYRQLSWQ
ncbi:MAG TPA: GNAT family acetyltransferase [Polyangia bacterium]|nr:GNAT family acetyltransferase [Polyangia bacterium]